MATLEAERTPLTQTGELYELPEEVKKIACLTADGVLYVAKAHENSDWILAFIDKLRRNNFEYSIKSVDIEFISELYRKSLGNHQQPSSSIRQQEVVDLIKKAVTVNSSDIHILVKEFVTTIKYRVDGDLKIQRELSAADGSDICGTIYQTMCDVAEPVFNPRRSQDARLAGSALTECSLYGGRIATRPTDSGLLMVIRLLYDRGDSQLDLKKLGYLPEQIKMIDRMAARRFGINILSGPTGSGKSTTLECILKNIISYREEKSHILTLEDPPEYKISGAVQTPILCDKDDDNAISREWARAISNAMRLDPDILMCGEIRDMYSAVATFRAAMTGHGVWTTVHANDALSILTRLQDIGISASILGDPSLITGLINQVLVKKLCMHCRIPYATNASQLSDSLRTRIETYCKPPQVYLRGKGCANCSYKAIAGRMVVAESIEPNAGLMEQFLKGGKNSARSYWVKEMKGITKNKTLIARINAGHIDPEDGESDVCMIDDDLVKEGRAAVC